MRIEHLDQLSQPKYRIIEQHIRSRIESGELAIGSKLPSEHDMATSLGVAYMTVRAAINELVEEGLLQRMQGKGTFVTGAERSSAAGTLTLLVPSLQQLWTVAGLYYFPSIVQGFCAEATRLGYEPSVVGRSKDAFQPASQEFAGIAGTACLLVHQDDYDAVAGLRDMKITTVGINAYRGRRAISYVAADQAGGMEQAVHALVRLGHHRIALLAGPEDNLGSQERSRGFRRALTRFGLPQLPLDATSGDYSDTGGYARAMKLLKQKHRPTAIATAGDLIAAGVLRAARELKLNVPRDLSVFGYGDFEIASHLQPALTTIRLPLLELGTQAARLLDAQLGGKPQRETLLLPTEIVLRDSIAAPRGEG